MGIKSFYGTNKTKETEGVWVPVAGGNVEVKIKRAGASNKPYIFEQGKMMRPYNKQIMAGTIDPEILRDINITLFAKHIVTDWKGEETKFSPKAFIELSKECPDFFNEVFTLANEMTTFQDVEDEELVKKPVSTTNTD